MTLATIARVRAQIRAAERWTEFPHGRTCRRCKALVDARTACMCRYPDAMPERGAA